jgi:PleD family two-component response regulator
MCSNYDPDRRERNGPATMPFVDLDDAPEDAPIKLLVVEGDDNEARLLRQILSDTRETRFCLVVAKRLEEAIRRAGENEFDAVLLDTELPDCGGLETVYRMQKAARDLPMVAMGTIDEPDVAIEAVRLGAEDYLLKHEMDGRTLIRALRLGIERNRMHQIHALTRLLACLEGAPVEEPAPKARGAAAGL